MYIYEKIFTGVGFNFFWLYRPYMSIFFIDAVT